MRLLALDTSTEYLSLALLLDDQIYQRDIHAGQSHSQQILPLLRELLNEAKVELQDLEGIVFGAGPGSFTGLRIACGVAQGLAFGANLPVIGVSTLMALAQNTDRKRVIACLDARMGEVYHAAYEKNGDRWDEVSAPGLYKPEAVPALAGDGWVGVGTGWNVYAEPLKMVYGEKLSEILLEAFVYDHPNAVAIAELAKPMFAAGLGRPAAEAAPIYIRNKVALKMSER
jgi:tRNA threonylcarbamoyladenosine biosynthesis protein TsaB